MKSMNASFRVVVPVVLAALLLGCFATGAKWMAYVYVNPNALNEVMLDSHGNAVHVSVQGDGVHLATYDGSGNITAETVAPVSLGTIQKTVQLPAQQLLLVGETLSGSWIADANAHTVTPLDVGVYGAGADGYPISGARAVVNGLVAAYGSQSGQGWGVVMDFTNGSSSPLLASGADSINRVHGHQVVVAEVSVGAAFDILTFDAELNALGRFTAQSGERLIGDSLGRPALFNVNTNDVRVTDAAGETQWLFENTELETVKGQNVGPDGTVLLWGDNANLLLGRLDQAHLLRIGSDGGWRYHYLGGTAMVNIRYTNVKQFQDSTVQFSFQGSTGQVNGVVIGGEVGVPYTVTTQIYHDFISPQGKKDRWMFEPKRTQTYVQGEFLPTLTGETEGHCNNLDVFNIDTRSLVTVSHVCGHRDDADTAITNVVKVARY